MDPLICFTLNDSRTRCLELLHLRQRLRFLVQIHGETEPWFVFFMSVCGTYLQLTEWIFWYLWSVLVSWFHVPAAAALLRGSFLVFFAAFHFLLLFHSIKKHLKKEVNRNQTVDKMETDVDGPVSQVSHYNPLFDMSLSKNELHGLQPDGEYETSRV